MSDSPDELREISTYYPEFWSEAGHLFTDTLYKEAGLDRKTIELILVALVSAKRWDTAVRVHTQLALDHGATAADVRGAILMSFATEATSAAAQGLHWAEDVLTAVTDEGEAAAEDGPDR